ncbi:sensor domain-containing protein [Mycobacterium sp.]|uniref:sensor domain-containing protein n=1 Tax=Mycobacterium sp. TaxID=1785 RepID=UPI003BA8AF6C
MTIYTSDETRPFPSASGDTATVVNTAEGAEGYVCARAITSRSNVVIDVYVCGIGITATQPAAVVSAIANKMPH